MTVPSDTVADEWIPRASSDVPRGDSWPASPIDGRRHRGRPGSVARLAAFHALVIASVVAIVVFQFTEAFSNEYRSTLTTGLSEEVSAFSRAALTRPATQSLAAFTRTFLANQASSAVNFTIVALPGDHLILGTHGAAALSRLPAIERQLDHAPTSATFTTLNVKAVPEIVLAVPVVTQGRRVGTFLTAASLADYRATRSHMFTLALAEGLILLLAAFVSVYLLLSRLLGSVRRLTRTAAEITDRGELGARLDETLEGDEVGEMAATFNAMIARIDTAISLQRQMMANVSHQLRTPITVVRGHLEVMSRGELSDPVDIRETITTVVDELDSMSRLVERLLLLGRSLEVDNVELLAVDLRALLLDLSSSFDVVAQRSWPVGPIPDVVIFADLDKLRSALLNLIENAVHATDADDSIHLWARVAASAPVPSIEIVVDDSGPGIAPSQREEVLRRFQSSSPSSSGGTGLGLAIVAAVARGHGGSVRLEGSPEGGCRVVLTLPLPAPGREFTVSSEEL